MLTVLLTPNDSERAETNRNLLIAHAKTGQTLYFPGDNTYYILPISKKVCEATDFTNCCFVGDGIRQSILALPPNQTEPMFDFDGMYFYDLHIRDLCFHGGNTEAPYLFRLNDGGMHYRILFDNVWFRNGKGDGLYIQNTQHISLRSVTCTYFKGWGLHLDGTFGVNITGLDIEQCGPGGMYIHNSTGIVARSKGPIVANQYHHESVDPFCLIEDVSNVSITGVTPTTSSAKPSRVVFGPGAKRNLVEGESIVAEYLPGSSDNLCPGLNTHTGEALQYNGSLPLCFSGLGQPTGEATVTIQGTVDRVQMVKTLTPGEYNFNIGYDYPSKTQTSHIHFMASFYSGKHIYYDFATNKFINTGQKRLELEFPNFGQMCEASYTFKILDKGTYYFSLISSMPKPVPRINIRSMSVERVTS